MKKTITRMAFVMCLALFTIGCHSDDDQFNPDDKDGDGVSNDNELLGSTDPNDPCDFNVADIYYPWTNQSWRNSDCDGDGVTNAKELDPDGNGIVEDNITNPLFLCDLIVANQNITPSEEWSNANCDGDPFSNAQEVIDGTDIFNTCDFLIGNQILEVNQTWLGLDCDEDGRNNGREIDDNTNPLDPADFDGAGIILKELYIGSRINYTQKHVFTANGALYDKVLRTDGSIVIDYEYDAQNRLISVLIDDNVDIVITYSYTGNQISQVTRTQGSNIYVLDVFYDGNIIYTRDGTEPEGLYKSRFTFNSQDILETLEYFYSPENLWFHDTVTFEYDSTFENVTSTNSEPQNYDESTGEFYTSTFVFYSYTSASYNSFQYDVINPFYESYQNIRLNIILSPNFFGVRSSILSGTIFNSYGALNTHFFSESGYTETTATGGTSYSYGHVGINPQDNGLPSLIRYSSFGGESNYELHYE